MARNIDISQLIKNEGIMKGRGSSGGGASVTSLNLVYSENNGKRLKFSNGLYEPLGKPEKVQFLPDAEGGNLIVGTILDENGKSFAFSSPESHIIYNSGLVKDIIDKFNLEFGEGRNEGRRSVSKSFSDIGFDTYNGNPVAIIKIR